MPRFSANLSMLFADVPLLARFDRARAAGFDAVELQFPYEVAADAIRQRLSDTGLTLVLHNLPAGDWAAGDRGIACNPARQQEFRDGVAKAIDYAKALEVPQLNCLSGLSGDDVDEHTARRTFIENLHFAAGECRNSNLGLLIEPVNSRDVPGFWLDTVSKAFPILDEVGADNLKLQFDIYHAQRSGGEIAATIAESLDRIGHIQFADNPGRNEPGTGELNFDFLFALIDRIGYSGWIGAEYRPAASTEAGLAWLEKYGV
ncbi:hydroxypyruvate isomerase [Mesorhizobium loti]|uniref:hydroxypyruvate isomerase n=1 Tax=Rhizobium loti TaxID=381 RepID=UPI00041597F8|nr:hydroxypyruvate isomerase [Mesorhizobium loti]